MQTRRAFIKSTAALGAFILAWFIPPGRLLSRLEGMLGVPGAKLDLPSEAVMAEGEVPSWEVALNRSALDDIIALTKPEMEGRRAGTSGDMLAARYLSQQMSSLGLKPLGNGDTYTQAFTLPQKIVGKVNGRTSFVPQPSAELRVPSVNLLAALEGAEENEAILLSAHFDHLGIYQNQVYPGANDNASGVGCILDVMRQIVREGIQPKKTIVLAFWGAEEMGFIGSAAFVENPTMDLSALQAVLNVDTVGNGTLGQFALWASGTNIAVQAIQAGAGELEVKAPIVPGNGHNSDQLPFANAGIPAVTLMSQDWLQNNHTPEDTLEKISPDQIKLATAIIDKAVRKLAF